MTRNIRHTQNFLHDPHLVEQIVAHADLTPGTTVLEVGPGKGIITRALAERVTPGGRVLAIELDPKLAAKLTRQFEGQPAVEIMHADALEVDLTRLDPPFAAFSNVPFNITTHFLEWLFTGPAYPQQGHLILQTETLISRNKYGTGETFKSLMIKPRYHIETVHTFARSDFKPRPGVDTALFQFTLRPAPLITDYDLYMDFLAYVTKDRVGEGVWKRVLPQKTLKAIPDLVYGRGLKSQSVEAITAAFDAFARSGKQNVVRGAMHALRTEQASRK